jgi:hypothetical protein
MKVFLTGTEYLQNMNCEMWTRIHNITRLYAEILVRNYHGFDQLALLFLNFLEYPKVTVFETGNRLSLGYSIIMDFVLCSLKGNSGAGGHCWTA